MHKIQEKILKLSEGLNLYKLTLREVGKKINEPDSPQKIKHHLNQLASKGFIKIDKKNKKIEKVRVNAKKHDKIVSLPIMGSANCGEATCFAEDYIEGYLHVSRGILGSLVNKKNNLFALRVVGSSLNRACINGKNIEDGDYILVSKNKKNPGNGDYVVSIINGVANIKKFYKNTDSVVLISESTKDIAPIYIHKKDLDDYIIAGTVVKVLKKPDELKDLEEGVGADILKDLGKMSAEENNYYNNL